MKWLFIGFMASVGWHLGDDLIDFLCHGIMGAIKKTRWYQTTSFGKKTVTQHNHANTVKNKIGFDYTKD